MAAPVRSLRRHISLRWQAVVAGLGIMLMSAFLVQSAGAYNTVLVAAAGGTFVEADVGGPRYINPVLCQFNQVDSDISALVFSGLTRRDERGNVVPDLATSWDISPDGKRYTFHLRNDAFWHDGQPVSAEDVAFTVGVLQSPDYPGPPNLARLWRDVKVTVFDERTVSFDLPEPYSPFLAYTDVGILPAHVLKYTPVTELTKSEFNRLPIGSGPYVVVEADAEHVLLHPSSRYYGEAPYLSAFEFRFFHDQGEALRAYERGEVSGIADVAPEYLSEVASSKTLVVYSASIARLEMVLLNLKSASATFLGDRSLRVALMLALDRQALVTHVLEGRGVPAHAPFASYSWALNPNGLSYSYDPAQAAKILDAQGWVDHDGDGIRDKDGQRLQFTLLVPDERSAKAVGQEIARQWRTIGVATEVKAVPFVELVEKHLQARQFDAALVDLSVSGDPDPYILWHSSQAQPGGQNYAAFVNPEADKLLESARRELDREKRQKMYYRFQDIFAEELPALPLYYPVYTYAVDQSVHGVELGPLVEPYDRFRSLPGWYVNYRRLRVREGSEGSVGLGKLAPILQPSTLGPEVSGRPGG
jgi:peptide/nickel transport system substrate-binding protein